MGGGYEWMCRAKRSRAAAVLASLWECVCVRERDYRGGDLHAPKLSQVGAIAVQEAVWDAARW